ncbi:MAG: DinB family protein [Chloroflexi bacterium]|nr:DinB family protein [Chloroflexota bacterium]
MAQNEFIERCLDQQHAALMKALEGLSQQELSYRPDPQCMSIGFLAWHLARAQDFLVQTVAKSAPQLWEGEWAARFGRTPANPEDIGFGFLVEQLEAFQVPEASVLRSYIEATRANALEHLRGMDDATLESTSVASPVGGQLTLASVYQQMVWELNQHGGQIAYLRGMQRGIEDPLDVGTVFGAARDAG